MIEIGKINALQAFRQTLNGWYLTDEEHKQEVLLPKRYVPENFKAGDYLSVFIFTDSEDRLTATTEEPKIMLHQFGCLQVKAVNRVGAFLDWGLTKDLLVPFSEQQQKLEKNQWCIVYLYLDGITERLVATNRWYKFLDQKNLTVKVGDEVDMLIAERSPLGVNVIINGKHRGLIFNNEIFKTLHIGEQHKGYIKDIRADNKITVSLQQQGYQNVPTSAQHILKKLEEADGFLGLNDKSKPDEIIKMLGMSKKTFKKSIGGLYKNKMIRIEKDGIHLVKKKS